MNENRELLTKWLKILFYIHIVSMVNSLISYLPINDFWYIWIQRGITAAAAFALFQLAPVEGRYKKASINRFLFLACLLITDLLFYSVFILLAGSVFSLIAVYQEYNAYADAIGELDPRLCKNWKWLFGLSILVSLLSSVISAVVALLLTQSTLYAPIINTVSSVFIRIPSFFIDVLYLLYLNRTIRIFQS